MHFEERLELEAIPEWRPKYVQYKALKQLLERCPELPPDDFDLSTGTYKKGSRQDMPCSDDEALFLSRVELELEKVNEFYLAREKEAMARKQQILYQVRLLNLQQSQGSLYNTEEVDPYDSIQKTSAMDTVQSSNSSTFILVNSLPIKSEKFKTFRQSSLTSLAKARIKKALLGFYRSLELLKDYRTVNAIAFGKIMKKFDKHTHRANSGAFMERVRQCPFYSSAVPDSLMADVENIYRRLFTNGDRSKALRKLKTPDLTMKSYQGMATMSGILIGLMMTVCFALIQVLRTTTDSHVLSLALIYGGLGLPLLMAALFSLNMQIWKSYHINYQFIFEFDQRTVLHNSEYNTFISAVSLYFLAFVYGSLNGSLDHLVLRTHQPWLLLITLMMIILLPVPTFFWHSRLWLGKVLFRIATAPFYPVRFKDFFLNDQFMSLGYFLQTFVLTLSITQHGNMLVDVGSLRMPSIWHLAVLSSLPAFWRIMQSLRRFWDGGRQFFPHMANLIKYSFAFSLPYVSFGTDSFPRMLWLKVLLQLIGALYSFGWDIFMDFGLFQRGPVNYLLRDTILFPPIVYYALFMVDFVLRFLWVLPLLRILPVSWPSLTVAYAFGVIEVVRRFIWNIFRVEYEHVNNCNAFKAFYEVQLPFALKDLFYQDMVEVEIAKNAQEVEAEEKAEIKNLQLDLMEDKVNIEGEESPSSITDEEVDDAHLSSEYPSDLPI